MINIYNRNNNNGTKNAKKIKSVHQPPPKNRQNPNKIMVTGGSDEIVSFLGPWSSPLCKKTQKDIWLTSTTRTTTTALKKPKKAQKFNIYSMTTTKNQEKSHLGQRLRLIWQKNFILGTIILTPMQKKSKKYTINFYNKDNNNGQKKRKKIEKSCSKLWS